MVEKGRERRAACSVGSAGYFGSVDPQPVTGPLPQQKNPPLVIHRDQPYRNEDGLQA
jgi:hypothetical protein